MSQIREMFISRYPVGRLVEIDYSQLEIYALAFLSGDRQLKHDLLSGADLHNISAENLFGTKFTLQQRKIAKQLSFQLQYGSGPTAMAESNGIPLDIAKKFIKNYYDRYPRVKDYQDENINRVKSNREQTPARTKKGLPAGKSVLKSITGRRYTFIETDAPEWSTMATSFSPTKIKNYPVQGFATGDIVPLILGKLYRELMKPEWINSVKLINTVHDSVLFDCRSFAEALMWVERAAEIMEDAPKYLKEQFNIDFDLPLRVEAEIGENWLKMEKCEIITY